MTMAQLEQAAATAQADLDAARARLAGAEADVKARLLDVRAAVEEGADQQPALDALQTASAHLATVRRELGL